jgi:hypothetical protein
MALREISVERREGIGKGIQGIVIPAFAVRSQF